MNKRFPSSAVFFLLLILFSFLIGKAFSLTDPRMLQIEKEEAVQTEDTLYGFEETFAVKTGNIQDILSFEETIPEKACQVRILSVPLSSGRLAACPGDLIPSGQAVLKYPDGSSFSLPENIRILSVLKESSSKIRIRYIPEQNILLKLSIPEKYLNMLSYRTPVRAWIGEEEIRAFIVRTGDTVKDHCFSVFLSLQDTNASGRTGCTVRIQITAQEKENVLLIPDECIYRNSSGEAFVIVSTEEGAFETKVETGICNGTMTEILSGLNETDFVVERS